MVGGQSFVRRGWHGREVVSSEVASNGGGGASDVGEHGEVVALLHDMHSHDRYMPRPLEFRPSPRPHPKRSTQRALVCSRSSAFTGRLLARVLA